MTDILYKAELSKAAEIWAQKNGYWAALQALPATALQNLQQRDFLELEMADGKTARFSVLRKTVTVSASGQVAVALFLDHPAR